MTIRPLAPGAAPAVRALWTRSAPLDPLPDTTLDALVWGDPPATVLGAHAGGRLVGIGVGTLWPTPGALRGSIRALAVAPEARRRGVGTALLTALETDLTAQGATALRLVEAAPTYLSPGIDARNAGALAFADASGYRPIGDAVNLGVDLAQDLDTTTGVARLAAREVTVRRASAADRAPLARLLDAHWPAWHPEAARALAAGTLHVARRGAHALGFAAHSANNAALGWFGPMGTAPEARGLGIGALLLRRCLADLRDAGHARATIAWAAALPFYARTCGATIERRFRRVEKAIGPIPGAPAPAPRARRPLAPPEPRAPRPGRRG